MPVNGEMIAAHILSAH